MSPQSSDLNMAGFVHIGKTGGSSISKLLRNGCSSFVNNGNHNKKKNQSNSQNSSKVGCGHVIPNGTVVSKNVERYYHVADFWRLPQTMHRKYLISVRDVYDRAVSALLYLHPENVKHDPSQGILTEKQKYFGPLAYQCFPTLEVFATLLSQRPKSSSTPEDCNYPYPHNMVEVGDCSSTACAAIHGKIRFFTHLFFNYRNILDTKLPLHDHNEHESEISSSSTKTNRISGRQIYVIRQEHLWDDWIQVNHLWGQPKDDPVIVPTSKDIDTNTNTTTMKIVNQRNISSLALPVTRSISQQGRERICVALELEYHAYFRMLVLAVNIKETDLQDCKRIAQRNCPNLNMDAILVSAKETINSNMGREGTNK